MKMRSTLYNSLNILGLLACTMATAFAEGPLAHTKWQHDLGNSGWNPLETVLTTKNVKPSTFGKVWERQVDGMVSAQPLYVANVPIPNKGIHNVVYAATEHNTLYAYDADSNASPNDQPLWSFYFGAQVPQLLLCPDMGDDYGVTSTPFIDLAHNRIYVVPKTLEFGRQHWRLHCLDIRSGKELPQWGFDIQGTFPGSGGGSVNGLIAFNPVLQFSRSALTMSNGRVYVTFGSHCDIGIAEYHGWIFSYSASNPLELPIVWNSSPDASGNGEAASGIWSAGASPAIDEFGDLFFITGNGPFDGDIGGNNLGDSIVRLRTAGGTDLSFSHDLLTDLFTPNNQAYLDAVDADLGSGGVTFLPTQDINSTIFPRMLAGGGKDGILRLLDRDSMGGYANPSPEQNLQNIQTNGGFWSTPTTWRSDAGTFVYSQGSFDVLRQFKLGFSTDMVSYLSPVATSPTYAAYQGATPTITSNGGNVDSGVLWLLDRNEIALRAYNANDVSQELYNSNQVFGRDHLATVVKFTVPTAIAGKVYVGSYGMLSAFGLNPVNPEKAAKYLIRPFRY